MRVNWLGQFLLKPFLMPPLPHTISHIRRNFRSPALKLIHPASKKKKTLQHRLNKPCVALVKRRDAESDVLAELIGWFKWLVASFHSLVFCHFFQHPENVRENGRLYFNLFAYVSFYVACRWCNRWHLQMWSWIKWSLVLTDCLDFDSLIVL